MGVQLVDFVADEDFVIFNISNAISIGRIALRLECDKRDEFKWAIERGRREIDARRDWE
jgi:hypothetical protein